MICFHRLVSHGFQHYQPANGSIAVIKKSRKLACNQRAWNVVSKLLISFKLNTIKTESLINIFLLVSSTLPVTQQPPLTPNKKTENHSPPSNILQSYNRQINADSDKYKQEEVLYFETGCNDQINSNFNCFVFKLLLRYKSQLALEWSTQPHWNKIQWKASMLMSGMNEYMMQKYSINKHSHTLSIYKESRSESSERMKIGVGDEKR